MTDVRDTQQLAIITGRQPATIRTVCRHLRGPDGYDFAAAEEALRDAPDPILLTATDAERYLGIPANRIHQWKFVDLVKPVDRDGQGRPLYAVDDLLRLRRKLDRKAQLDL